MGAALAVSTMRCARSGRGQPHRGVERATIIGMFMPKLGFAQRSSVSVAPACRLHLGRFVRPPHDPCSGSGLLKRIETSERYLAFTPEVCRVAKHVEQLLARLAVEAWVVGDLLSSTTTKPGCVPALCTRSVMQSYSASRFLPKWAGNRNGGNAVEHVLRLDWADVRLTYREMLPRALGSLLQVLDAIGAYRLHDVRTDCLQEHVAILLHSKNPNARRLTPRCGQSSRSGRRCRSRHRERSARVRHRRSAARRRSLAPGVLTVYSRW